MADTAQINPKIPLATKVRLLEFCKARGHAQGEVVAAALEAYLTPADGDAQALLFQKVHGLEQGMKDVATLLETVIQHLERHAKPLPPKMATRAELYPELAPAVKDLQELPAVEKEPVPEPRRPLWKLLLHVHRSSQA
jgi:hypothetical protein